MGVLWSYPWRARAAGQRQRPLLRIIGEGVEAASGGGGGGRGNQCEAPRHMFFHFCWEMGLAIKSLVEEEALQETPTLPLVC